MEVLLFFTRRNGHEAPVQKSTFPNEPTDNELTQFPQQRPKAAAVKALAGVNMRSMVARNPECVGAMHRENFLPG